MNANSNNYIPLAGGLGNQLFQLSAGLAISKNNNILLITNLLTPRTDAERTPDLFQFELPENAKRVDLQNLNRFHKFLALLSLKLSVSNLKRKVSRIAIFLVGKISKPVFSLVLRKDVNFVISEGVGFSAKVSQMKNSLCIGYFQSYLWVGQSDVLPLMRSIKTHHSREELSYIESLAEKDQPLVVHVRLGDYLNEDDFGIPSAEYYSRAIKTQLKSGRYNAIWAFSDDPENAQRILPKDLEIEVKWNIALDASSAGTLQTMRFGKGYVIANSTFSWWGAFLSFEENPTVVAPNPWFKNLDTPQDLIPDKWLKIDAW
jgi:hypothetical protein